MKLTKIEREQVKNKFGCRCAYCGVELGEKWHVDHLEPVRRDFDFVRNSKGYLQAKSNGVLLNPENDNMDNLMPSCIRCNLSKSSIPLEAWRNMIKNFLNGLVSHGKYAMFQHAKRFGLVVEVDGAVDNFEFWFEKYTRGEQYIPHTQVIKWYKFKDRKPEIGQKILAQNSKSNYNESIIIKYHQNFHFFDDDMWCLLPTPK